MDYKKNTIESLNLSSPFKFMLLGIFIYLTLENIRYILELFILKVLISYDLNPIFGVISENLIPVIIILLIFMIGIKLINNKISLIRINKIILISISIFIISYIVILLSGVIFILLPEDTILSEENYINLKDNYPLLDSTTIILSDIIMYSSMIIILLRYKYFLKAPINNIK